MKKAKSPRLATRPSPKPAPPSVSPAAATETPAAPTLGASRPNPKR